MISLALLKWIYSDWLTCLGLNLNSLCLVKALSPQQTGMVDCPKLLIFKTLFLKWIKMKNRDTFDMWWERQKWSVVLDLWSMCLCINTHPCGGLPWQNLTHLLKVFSFSKWGKTHLLNIVSHMIYLSTVLS